MRTIRNLWFCLLFLLPLSGSACGQGNDDQERVKEFIAYARGISEYSVVFREVSLFERKGSLVAKESLYRQVSLNHQTRVRLDEECLQNGEVTYRSHDLKIPGIRLSSFGTEVGSSVQEYQANGLRSPRSVPLLNLNMIALVVKYSEIFGGKEIVFMEGFRIYDREEQKDGKLKLFFVHEEGLAVSEVTFHADPTWLPIRIDYFHNPDQKPIGTTNVTRKSVEKWRRAYSTNVIWRKLDEATYLPLKVIFERDVAKHQFSSEITFADWKLGKEVDQDLLLQDAFVPDGLKRTTNFREMENLILQVDKDFERLRYK